MALSGPEIQDNLNSLAAKWSPYAGTEKAEAQTFLNDLFAAYGLDRLEAGAKFEDFKSSAGFMDLHWPGICIFEMKKPGTELKTARDQVHRYRMESADEDEGIPAAKYVVICSFQKFEIWQPGDFPKSPRAVIDLADLPERYDVLNFLAGPNVEPSFVLHDREMTKDAAEKVALMYQSLLDRVAAPGPELQRFVMQSVWCMFAEDLHMLIDWPFEKTVDALLKDPNRSSAEALGYLFKILNQKGNHNRQGILAGTTYVNGELFAEPAEVNLNPAELRLLRQAIEFNWSQVDPTIFGSLMEGVLGDRRWELGAHYTHEVDIMKIVGPTIVQPWTTRIDAASSPDEGRHLLDELCAFKVLDPACGCGNFLYIAYRELRALEFLLKQRIVDLAHEKGLSAPSGSLPFVRLTNMQGIEIEPMAALIARVTLWMGHRQMIDLYGQAEDPLPLVALSTIQIGDALSTPWPETDCIIGNPPFLGDRNIRAAFGDGYANWLSKAFGVGIKDFCVYWFRKAAEHLKPNQRAGLVGTNSVSQNRGRSASLNYVVELGGIITEATSSQRWPGDAKVHVSIVNWVAQPSFAPTRFILDGVNVSGIRPDLRVGRDTDWEPRALTKNSGRAFYGPVPIGKGFVVPNEFATTHLVQHPDAARVLKPYLTGNDIIGRPDQGPSRWTIDFGTLPLEDAQKYPELLSIVRNEVKPERETNKRASYRRRWWQFGEPCVEMRTSIKTLDRFVIGLSTGKRAAFMWADQSWIMNNSTVVFAFDDDFSMAVLQSRAHHAWAWQRSSTLETRIRYTPSSVFESFAWPADASKVQRERAADVCRGLLAHRSDLCLERNVGLTKLYNAMDDGAYADLKALHEKLDVAIADCYGWPKADAQDDKALVRGLTELNRQITGSERAYDPFH